MTFRPDQFYMACFEGLVLTSGYAFEFGGRTFIVHRCREPFSKEWEVSDKELGFGFGVRSKTRAEAVKVAKQKWQKLSQGNIDFTLHAAELKRKTLKVIA